jgi:peptide deformylase
MFKVREIVKDNQKSIREKSVEVEFPLSDEDKETMEYMLEHLRLSQDEETSKLYGLRPGVGLAAPQIGVNKRMFAVLTEDENGKVHKYGFINPKITSYSVRKAYLKGGEGCLSVDTDKEGFVPRAANITIEGYDYVTKTILTKKLRGYISIVVQHEYDHLNGVLFYDHINKEEPYLRIPDALEI